MRCWREAEVKAEVEDETDLSLNLSLDLSFDAVVAINIAPPYLDSVPIARGICDAAAATGKPVVASFLPEAVTADAVAYLQAHGVLNFPTPERAVAAVAGMAGYSEAAKLRSWKLENQRDQRVQRINQLSSFQSPAIQLPFLEPDAMAWLRENGIATPPFRFAATAAEAVAACAEIGFPGRDEGRLAGNPAQERTRRRDRRNP